MIAFLLLQAVAPPPALPLGPQKAVRWSCDLVGPNGERHNVAGTFEAPAAVTQSSYGTYAKISAVVDRDTTGFLIGRYDDANGNYVIPRSFRFGSVRGDVVTFFSLSYSGRPGGSLATVTQIDSARHAPTYFKAIGTGYCQTTESAK